MKLSMNPGTRALSAICTLMLIASCSAVQRNHDGPPRPERRTAAVTVDLPGSDPAVLTHIDGRPAPAGDRWILAPGWHVVTLEQPELSGPVDLGAVFEPGVSYRITQEPAGDPAGEPAELRLVADPGGRLLISDVPQIEDLLLPTYPEGAPAWPLARWYRAGDHDVAVHRPRGVVRSDWTRRLVRSSIEAGTVEGFRDEIEETGGTVQVVDVGQGRWLARWQEPDLGGTRTGVSALRRRGGRLFITSFQTRFEPADEDPQLPRWREALGQLLESR